MSSDIYNALQFASMGMKAQGTRIRVISENVANAETAGSKPGEEPYRRQTVSFKNELDRQLGLNIVGVDKISEDMKTPFPIRLMPGHPAADESGYVRLPNMNILTEMMDLREAQRSYEANLGMIEQARTMISRTIDLLRF